MLNDSNSSNQEGNLELRGTDVPFCVLINVFCWRISTLTEATLTFREQTVPGPGINISFEEGNNSGARITGIGAVDDRLSVLLSHLGTARSPIRMFVCFLDAFVARSTLAQQTRKKRRWVVPLLRHAHKAINIMLVDHVLAYLDAVCWIVHLHDTIQPVALRCYRAISYINTTVLLRSSNPGCVSRNRSYR